MDSENSKHLVEKAKTKKASSKTVTVTSVALRHNLVLDFDGFWDSSSTQSRESRTFAKRNMAVTLQQTKKLLKGIYIYIYTIYYIVHALVHTCSHFPVPKTHGSEVLLVVSQMAVPAVAPGPPGPSNSHPSSQMPATPMPTCVADRTPHTHSYEKQATKLGSQFCSDKQSMISLESALNMVSILNQGCT